MRSRPPLGDGLEARLGTPKRVRSLASSPRSDVWRATFGGTRAVIKHLVAGDGADDRFAREVAVAEAEAAYAEASGHPIDEQALADVCTSWTIRGDALVERAYRETHDHLARLTVEDWKWWTVSARDRLAHRLGVVGGLGHDDGPLGETARTAVAMRAAMLERWPGLRPLPTKRP